MTNAFFFFTEGTRNNMRFLLIEKKKEVMQTYGLHFSLVLIIGKNTKLHLWD
jgi:ATP-dependent RNA circularization protein (DNA/RNA ligase family)